MKKGILLVTLVALVLLLLLSVNCSAGRDTGWRDIRLEAAETLIQLSEKGIKETSADVDRIEEHLLDTHLKLVRLEQVVAPSLNWIESQKNLEHKPMAWVKKEVTPEGLAKVSNDKFQVTRLELLATQNEGSTAWVFSSTMTIKDLSTGSSYDQATLKDDLNRLKGSLEQQRKAKLDSMVLAIATLKDVIETVKGWEVQRVSNGYYFSGTGLGWADKLAAGKWSYQRANRDLTPADEPARALNEMLTARR